MSETTTVAALETAKAPKAKKSAATKPAPKAETNGKPKMGKNHILYLKALVKKPLTRKEAWEATGLKDPSSSSQYLGRSDPETRKADEAKWGYVSLQTLGYVKARLEDRDGKDVVVFSITAAGRKALEKAAK